MVNIDAVEENLEVFGNVVATAPAEEDTTVEDNLEVFVNVEEDTVEEVFGNVEEDTVEEVFGNVVNLASASVEEETGVKNLTSYNITLIDPNKMKVKELKF